MRSMILTVSFLLTVRWNMSSRGPVSERQFPYSGPETQFFKNRSCRFHSTTTWRRQLDMVLSGTSTRRQRHPSNEYYGSGFNSLFTDHNLEQRSLGLEFQPQSTLKPILNASLYHILTWKTRRNAMVSLESRLIPKSFP